METGLKGKTVLITEGGVPLGRSMTRAFAREGSNLIVGTSQMSDLLDETIHQAELSGTEIASELWDITDEVGIQTFVREGLDKFGRIDVLINNVETQNPVRNFEDLTYEAWKHIIDVILTGSLFVSKAVLPGMIENKWGRIINYTGLAAFFGTDSAYSTAQLGAIGLTRGIARWYGKYNITANCIGPGGIKTDAESLDASYPPEQTHPVPRWGVPQEVASLAVYLASEDAAYITGQCYLVNGGKYFL